MQGIGKAVLIVWALGSLTVGCGSDSDKRGAADASAPDDGAVNAQDANGANDAGEGGMSPAPKGPPYISSAPASWERPAECRGVGDACEGLFGCEVGSTCQSLGNVCIPDIKPGSSTLQAGNAEYPYCAAYTCMSFEEASCFCTGDAAKTYAACASPKALAGLCVAEGSACDTRECCDALSCVDNGSGRKTCQVSCESDSDCETGCCTDRYDVGVKICSPKASCDSPCKKVGEGCTSDTSGSDCCRGTCLTSEVPEWNGCRPRCQTNADCADTGCCQPFSNGGGGFCTDAKWCSCGAAGASCGGNTPQCCSGTLCTGQTAETLRCNPLCTSNSDCASNCCLKVTGTTSRVCSEASRCQP